MYFHPITHYGTIISNSCFILMGGKAGSALKDTSCYYYFLISYFYFSAFLSEKIHSGNLNLAPILERPCDRLREKNRP